MPLSSVLSGGLDALGILNPGIGAEMTRKDGQTVSYSAPGEMVWAIAYRKIRYDAFKRRSVSSAHLDKTIHWKPLSAQRSQSDEDEEVFEVELKEQEPWEGEHSDEKGIEVDTSTLLLHTL